MGGRCSALLRVLFPVIFLVSSSFLYADEPAVTSETQAKSSGIRSKAERVVDAALQPGTFQTIENLVKIIGDGIDWYFDQLVNAADQSRLSESSNSVVKGIGQGLVDVGVDKAVNDSLDLAEQGAEKFYLKEFDRQILKGTQVKVHPYLKSAMEYYSNVFYEPEAPKTRDEVLWVFKPGVTANFPFGDEKQYRIGAAYEARITEFTKYGEHDDIGQSAGLIGDFKLTDALYTNIREELIQDAARAATRSAKRVEYIENTVTPTVGYNWRDWTFEGEYTNSIRDFDSSIYRAFSYANNAVQARVFRTLAPSFRGLIDYTFSHYDYAADETRVGWYNQIRTGVTGKLSERTALTARVGYQSREYEAHDTQFDIPVADVRLTHRLTSKTNLDFYFHRTTRESSFTNNRAYDEKLFQASGNYLFNSRFRGRTGTSFIRREFENVATTGAIVSERRDILGTAFVGFDYAFRPWLIMNLDYKYERSNSNNSNFDYTNNLVSVGMTMPL
jgi:hypothetical protein